MDQELRNILNRVSKLFFNYGIKSLTMDDISRELGISKKTLYQYVNNKEELVQKTLEALDCEHDEEMEKQRHPELNAIQSLWRVNTLVSQMIREQNPSAQYDLKKYYPKVFTNFRHKRVEKIKNLVIRNLQQGKQEGLYRHRIDEQLIAKFYLSRISHTTDIDSVFTHEEMLSPNFMPQLMEYHIRGIASKKGIEILETLIEEVTNE